MDIMKNALMKRKKDLESGFKISLEITPNEENLKDEEQDKKIGLAPEVKDGESPKEKKLMPEVEIEIGEEKEGEEEEPKEMDDEMMKSAMPELPNGREAISLHEKAMKKMMDKKAKN